MNTPPPSSLSLTDAEKERFRQIGPRTWQRMLSGRRLNLVDPWPPDIEIEDIALALSRNTRWNGQTHGDHGWSVAQHSDVVVQLVQKLEPRAPAWVLMAAKLHDAPEFVTHDLITPLKAVVGDVFREVEDRLAQAIHIRFGVPAQLPSEIKGLIKQADWIAGASEAVQLAGFTEDELKPVLGLQVKPDPSLKLVPLPSKEAERAFLSGFAHLQKKMQLEQGA